MRREGDEGARKGRKERLPPLPSFDPHRSQLFFCLAAEAEAEGERRSESGRRKEEKKKRRGRRRNSLSTFSSSSSFLLLIRTGLIPFLTSRASVPLFPPWPEKVGRAWLSVEQELERSPPSEGRRKEEEGKGEIERRAKSTCGQGPTVFFFSPSLFNARANSAPRGGPFLSPTARLRWTQHALHFCSVVERLEETRGRGRREEWERRICIEALPFERRATTTKRKVSKKNSAPSSSKNSQQQQQRQVGPAPARARRQQQPLLLKAIPPR